MAARAGRDRWAHPALAGQQITCFVDTDATETEKREPFRAAGRTPLDT